MKSHRHPRRGKFILCDDSDPLTLWSSTMYGVPPDYTKVKKEDSDKTNCSHDFKLVKGFNFDKYICTICKQERDLVDNEK